MPSTPLKFLGLRTAVYAATDLAAAREWYTTLLGAPPYFNEPFFVGFSVQGFELGITPSDDAGPRRAPAGVAYWGVTDARAAFARLIELGATEQEAVQDVGDDVRIGAVWDPFGNVLGIVENPHFKAVDT